MNAYRISVLFFVCLLFSSCSKKSSATEVKDTTAPVITITSPSNNQTFSAGQTIAISASATDNVKVSQMHIHVLNKTTGSLLRDVHAYPDAVSGTILDSFAAQSGIAYLITIIVYDPAQNISTAEVEVSAN